MDSSVVMFGRVSDCIVARVVEQQLFNGYSHALDDWFEFVALR